jgi:CMP-N-acetylneuraminic acid synthetase
VEQTLSEDLKSILETHLHQSPLGFTLRNFLDSKNFIYSEIVGLQPTSPLRNKNDIDDACQFYMKNKFDSLFTALKNI